IQNEDRDSMVIQRLLCRGLRTIAQNHADAGLRFLCGDPRRLVLGHYEDEYADTCSLISAVLRHLNASQAAELETAVLAWERYRPDKSGLPPDVRFETTKWE